MKSSFDSTRGLTLIELLVTMSITAVMAMIAVPQFSDLIHDRKQGAKLNEFKNAVQLARSEAVKRAVRTALCTSADANSCNVSAPWTDGWMVFVDDNANGSRDSSEEIVRVGVALPSGYMLNGSTNVSSIIRYGTDGDSLESGTITLCDPRGAEEARAVIISASGKPKTSTTGAGGAILTCP